MLQTKPETPRLSRVLETGQASGSPDRARLYRASEARQIRFHWVQQGPRDRHCQRAWSGERRNAGTPLHGLES